MPLRLIGNQYFFLKASRGHFTLSCYSYSSRGSLQSHFISFFYLDITTTSGKLKGAMPGLVLTSIVQERQLAKDRVDCEFYLFNLCDDRGYTRVDKSLAMGLYIRITTQLQWRNKARATKNGWNGRW